MVMTVEDVMGKVAITAPLHASLADLVDTMRRYNVGAVTVIDGDRRPVGVVTDDDVLLRESPPRPDGGGHVDGRGGHAEQPKAAGTTAREMMTSPAVTVAEGASVRDAVRLMHAERIRQLPVINVMTGRVIGTVHQKDLLKVFGRPAADIERDIGKVLEQVSLSPEGLGITVEAGVVTLTGQVPLRSQIASLTKAVEALDGVVDVGADLTFAADDLTEAPPFFP